MKRILVLGVLVGGIGLGFTATATAAQFLYKQAAGKQLVLHDSVRVPVGTATVYFQGGAVVSAGGLNEFIPYCALVVDRLSETSQRVPAGSYRIVKLFPYEDEDANLGSVNKLVGTRGWGFYKVGVNTEYYFMTRLKLASTTIPKLLYLDCGSLWDYSIGDHISVTEFKNAVGPWLSLAP